MFTIMLIVLLCVGAYYLCKSLSIAAATPVAVVPPAVVIPGATDEDPAPVPHVRSHHKRPF